MSDTALSELDGLEGLGGLDFNKPVAHDHTKAESNMDFLNSLGMTSSSAASAAAVAQPVAAAPSEDEGEDEVETPRAKKSGKKAADAAKTKKTIIMASVGALCLGGAAAYAYMGKVNHPMAPAPMNAMPMQSGMAPGSVVQGVAQAPVAAPVPADPAAMNSAPAPQVAGMPNQNYPGAEGAPVGPNMNAAAPVPNAAPGVNPANGAAAPAYPAASAPAQAPVNVAENIADKAPQPQQMSVQPAGAPKPLQAAPAPMNVAQGTIKPAATQSEAELQARMDHLEQQIAVIMEKLDKIPAVNGVKASLPRRSMEVAQEQPQDINRFKRKPKAAGEVGSEYEATQPVAAKPVASEYESLDTQAKPVKMAAASQLSLQAVIPGRAWLINGSSGEVTSVEVGNQVAGCGKVAAIDASNGEVVAGKCHLKF